MADKQIYELTTKTAKHKAVDTVVSSTSTDEMTKSTHELFLATELNPMSASVSTTYKALTSNPLRGSFINVNGTKTKASHQKVMDLGQESVGVRYSDKPTSTILEIVKTTEFAKYKTGSFSLGFVLENNPTQPSSAVYYLASSEGTRPRLVITEGTTGTFAIVVEDDSNNSIFSYSVSDAERKSTKHFAIVFERKSSSTVISYYSNNILRKSVETLASVTFNTQDDVVLKPGSLVNSLLRCQFFNYALTASDVSYYWNNGRPDLALVRDYDKWGSNSELIVDAGFDDPTKWTVNGYWSIADSKMSRSASSGTAYFSQANTIKAGSKYRITFEVDSASANDAYLLFTNELTANLFSSGYTSYVKGTTHIIEAIAISNATAIRVYSTGASSFSLNSLSIIQLGSVLDLNPAGIADPVVGTETNAVIAGTPYEVSVALTANEINPAHADYVGANDNAIGTRFVATQSRTLTSSGRVKPLGLPTGAGLGWTDASTNALNATVSGSPIIVKTQVEEKQGDGIKAEIQTVLTSIHTVLTPTISVPANHVIESIVIKNTGANAITSFKAGVGAGEEVIALDSSSLASGASRAYFAKSPVTYFKETEAVTITLTTVQASTYAWESTVTFRRVK